MIELRQISKRFLDNVVLDGVVFEVRYGETVARLGASGVAQKFPAELSGGMRKRVGIARAIAGQPKYLLYDEPTSGLDPVNADVIDALIERLQSELGVTSVVVSHDVRGSFRVADRVALLWQAKIRAVGNPEEILASRDPAVQQFLERDLEMALIQSEADQGEAERGEQHGA